MSAEQQVNRLTRILAIGAIVVTVIAFVLWLSHVLRSPITNSVSYLRLVPFLLAFVWVLHSFVKTAKGIHQGVLHNSAYTPLFLLIGSRDFPIESRDFLIMAWLMLIYLIVIGVIDHFAPRLLKMTKGAEPHPATYHDRQP